MKKKLSKFISLFIVVGMLFPMVAISVLANDVYEDGNSMTINGYTSINENTFIFDHGQVTVTKTPLGGAASPVNTASVSLSQGDQIVISLFPAEGFNAVLHNNTRDFNVGLTDNSYSFTIGKDDDGQTLSFTPSFTDQQQGPGPEGPGPEDQKQYTYDFTINDKPFTDVKNGDVLDVPDNFDMSQLKTLCFNKIQEVDNEGHAIGQPHVYQDGIYSLDLLDSQDRQILEANFTPISENAALLRVDGHGNDIINEKIQEADRFYFYIPELYFKKAAFRGVEISTPRKPDNYDFTSWNGVDLKATTPENPGEVTVFYGDNTIELTTPVSSPINTISLSSGIPASAVTIDNTAKTVTVNSNFYNEIPLKIELYDGTVGYITINRIGIFIGTVDVGGKTFYHGAAMHPDFQGNLNKYTDQYRIAAVFYHEDTTTYEDYDLVVNLTYADGTTETTLAEGVGDVPNSNGDIVGSDYILWKGNSNKPVKVSVTAVKKGALDNVNEFGGATFGAGAGVEWVRE